MAYRGKERRRQYRIKVRLPLVISSPTGKILGYTTNVSLLGAYVESSKRLIPSAKKRELTIELTSSRKIKCSGVILGCEPKAKSLLSKKIWYHSNIFFSDFFNDGERRLADHLEMVIKREKKVLDRWIKEKKTKKGNAKERG